MITLLHITDFHLRSGEDPSSPLGYGEAGRSYIRQLCEAIKVRFGTTIDYIVATGDFVHVHDEKQYSVAIWVMSTISSSLGVPNDRIIVCPGNHDYVWDLQKAGQIKEARKAYLDFEKQFAQPNYTLGSFGRVFVDETRKTTIVSLDSTWNASGRSPGKLLPTEMLELQKFISVAQDSHDLLIATHFPPLFPPEFASEIEVDEHFVPRHIWMSGSEIAGRLTVGRRVIWLYGDLHFDGEYRNRGDYFFLTGSLGMSAEISKDSGVVTQQPQVMRTARIVTVKPRVVESTLFSYDVRSWNPASWNGKWHVKEGRSHGLIDSEDGRDDLTKRASNLELLSPELEELLLDIVREQKLYKFGRFHHRDGVDVLAAIRLSPIFAEKTVLLKIVTSMSDWLLAKIGESACRESLALVAVDCWGTLIATHLAARLNCPKFSFIRTTSMTLERQRPEDASRIQLLSQVRNIVLICDVVSVGRGFADAYEHFAEALGDETKRMHWWCLSVFCDESHEMNHRFTSLAFVQGHGTAVKSLRIPILKDALPDKDFVPYEAWRL